MAKYEVRIKGNVRVRVNNNNIKSIRVDEITEANDLTYVNHLRSREGRDHWARTKYGNVVDWSLHVSYKVIKEEQQKTKRTKSNNDTETSGGSWGCFAILKPIWWIFKLIRWIFRLIF